MAINYKLDYHKTLSDFNELFNGKTIILVMAGVIPDVIHHKLCSNHKFSTSSL